MELTGLTPEQVAERVTKAMGLKIVPDQSPEQGSYYRSDHFSFGKVGIPAFSISQGRDLIGKPILGWRSPSGRKTAHTMRVLRSLGYIYDSSDKDYDLPYRLRFGANQNDWIVELPNNTYSLDDFPFYKFSYTPPSEVLAQWKSEFDAIYGSDRFVVLCVHPRSG